MFNMTFHLYTKTNFFDAIKELIFVLIAALLPVWLGILFNWLSAGTSVSKFIVEFLSSGEALLISSALVGPPLYVLLKSYGNLPRELSFRFPFGWLIVTLILVISVTSAAVFGYKSSNPPAGSVVAENMMYLSAGILLVSLITLLVVYVIRNNIEQPASKIMQSGTREFIEDWKK